MSYIPSGKTPNQAEYYVIGFDSIYPELQRVSVSSDKYEISYLSADGTADVSKAKGVIVLQGSFERFSSSRGSYGLIEKCDYSKDQILKKQKEIQNVIIKKGWVCFLVRDIKTKLKRGINDRQDISDTDLTKVMLNDLGVYYRNVEPPVTQLNSRFPEFNSYLEKYGIGKTSFQGWNNFSDTTQIVSQAGETFGFEIERQIFFLPFLDKDNEFREAGDVTDLVISAIVEYRKNQLFAIPDWVNEIVFNKEIEAQQKIDEIKNKFGSLESELKNYHEYKSILTTKGTPLVKKIDEILQKYFGLNVKYVDELNEDIALCDENDKYIGIFEIKGINKGVSREHINQTDTIRAKVNLGVSAPAVLIINNAMSKSTIQEKNNAVLANEQVEHAKRNNILILRTIDLLNIMKLWESKSISDRKNSLLAYINNSHGWLRADGENIELI